MDLLKSIQEHRSIAPTGKPRGKLVPTADGSGPGTRAMRYSIIEEKPSKKVMMSHIQAIITADCESDED
jgi:hypothetical protein